MGSECLMGMGFPIVVMKIFWHKIVVMVVQHCECM